MPFIMYYFTHKAVSVKKVLVFQHAMYTQNRKSGLEDITRFGSIGALTGDNVSY